MVMTRREFASLITVGAAGAMTTWRAGLAKAWAAGNPAVAEPPAMTAEAAWADLTQGNRRFVAGKPRARSLVLARKRLAQGQHPKAIVLGCSDSRVSPTLVFDQSLGDLFVVRTAGNVADPVALGSIEYAVEHLHVRLLLVLGHERCGAVTAAASGEKMPTPNLEALVAKIAPAITRVKDRATGDQLITLGVEANVDQSAADIVAQSPIVRKAVEAGTLGIVRAVYRLASGEVVRLA